MAEPPAPEDVWEEILLRLPPDDPASLLRASLVCKKWRRVVTRRGFLRRLAQLHGAPPILGFFKNPGLSFVPTTAGKAISFPVPEPWSWGFFVDCRHGRALLVGRSERALLVWEPMTGYRRRVPLPVRLVEPSSESFMAAVVCAVDGCGHWDCHGGPFRVVVVWARHEAPDQSALVWEYSSVTGAWGEPTPIPVSHDKLMDGQIVLDAHTSFVVGNHLYFFCGFLEILKYDLGGQGPAMTVIQLGDMSLDWSCLMEAEDGGLGVAGIKDSCLHMWSLRRSGNAEGDADAGWVLRRTIHLENLLPAAALAADACISVFCFVEGMGMNVVFLVTKVGIFTIELKSGQTRRVCGNSYSTFLFPFVGFYAPGMQADAGEQGNESMVHKTARDPMGFREILKTLNRSNGKPLGIQADAGEQGNETMVHKTARDPMGSREIPKTLNQSNRKPLGIQAGAGEQGNETMVHKTAQDPMGSREILKTLNQSNGKPLGIFGFSRGFLGKPQ